MIEFRCLRYELVTSSTSFPRRKTPEQLTLRQSSSALSVKYFPDIVTADGCIFGRPDDFVLKAGFVYDSYEGKKPVGLKDCCPDST